ncbi:MULTISPECIES: hypothetical protein [unclassified Haematobacter]|uniref:hypothetical protein n=1 Tax=unclassified Haematobacter TaxID=2640585 RepID=UPI0025BEB702|nr:MULTISPECIES: hypothetical protein [unclassified Haematobacter]
MGIQSGRCAVLHVGAGRGKLLSALEWALIWGDKAEDQRLECEKAGRPIPSHLWPVEPPQGYEQWFEIFFEVSNDRQLGHGAVGPIPASSLARYDFGPDQRAFVRAIRAMDQLFMRHLKTAKPGSIQKEPMTKDRFDRMF